MLINIDIYTPSNLQNSNNSMNDASQQFVNDNVYKNISADKSSSVSSVNVSKPISKTLPKTVKESYTNIVGKGDNNFINLNIDNGLNSFPHASFSVITEKGFNKATITNGDIVVISSDSNIVFYGYVKTLTVEISNTSGYLLNIDAYGFIDRLSAYSFLALNNNNVNGNEESLKFSRSVNQGFAMASNKTFAELVNIYSDLNQEAYYSGFYYASNSCLDVIFMIANSYARKVFARRNGSIYVSQIYGSNSVSDYFNIFSEKDFNVLNSSYTQDFSSVSKVTDILWSNSILVNNSYITGTITFNDFPNFESVYANIETIPLMLNPNIGQGILNANYKTYDSPIFTIDAKIELLKNKDVDKSTLENYIRLQLLTEFYKKIENVKTITAEVILDDVSILVDVGDTIEVQDVLYTVKGVSISFDNAEVYITGMPLQYTNPTVESLPSQRTISD